MKTSQEREEPVAGSSRLSKKDKVKLISTQMQEVGHTTYKINRNCDILNATNHFRILQRYAETPMAQGVQLNAIYEI